MPDHSYRRLILRAIFIYCLFLLPTISCTQKKTAPQIKTVEPAPVSKKDAPDSVVLLDSNDQVRIYGNISVKDKNVYAEVKFEPYFSFADFRVIGKYSGKKHPIDYSSNRLAREYRTIITATYKENGVMFAGHYSFASWGCGSPCQGSAIVDLADGKVYEGIVAANGFSYQPNSRLLIVNPPDSLGFYEPECVYCHPELWIWDEQHKRFKQRLPDGSTNLNKPFY